MTSVNQVRSSFLEYFRKYEHEVVPSSPLVPHHDPTLMFTNAGMVPFKHVFTGQETLSYDRATSSQKCVRAGGKHNDLDNVGYTARHHTFFEMLGNFSFGNYFKEQAIYYAWECITKEFCLDPKRLYVTIYHEDSEAQTLWKKISQLPDDHIIPIATSDNFWAMGDTGPCGPCSEIFFDHGDKVAGGLPGTKNEDGDRYVEIWNLVFMQYNTEEDGNRVELPKPSIDTGMGLERMAAVLQGVHDNYAIDLFQSLMSASKEFSQNHGHEVSHRVIADHLRASCFLLADGVMPSNEGRGYVLRRIMRRAMRHVHQLGCKDPLMSRLVPQLILEMGGAYPELQRAKGLMVDVLEQEEVRFNQTLTKGLSLLSEASNTLKAGDQLDGEVAFKLYDTYGFPLDLTKDILRERDITVDDKGFESAMDLQKKRAKAAWSGSGEAVVGAVYLTLAEKFGATEFVGYETDEIDASVIAIIKDGEEVGEANSGDKVGILLNQTPCYAESGGQEGDHGSMTHPTATIAIHNTTTEASKLHLHHAEVKKGTIKVEDAVTVKADSDRRQALRQNHSATHILHAVLRDQLGDHVVQKGSLVASDRFRFDFSYPKGLTKEILEEIETKVNDIIASNTKVSTHLMEVNEAQAKGAVALFGEKYADQVRVVSMGTADYSMELCGGLHVAYTGDIGLFVIMSESAVAAGIRRIEALTGKEAYRYLRRQSVILQHVSERLKTPIEEVEDRIQQLQGERKALEKQLAQVQKQAALGGDNTIEPKEVAGISFVAKHMGEISAKTLRDMVMDLKGKHPNAVLALSATDEGKASIIVALSGECSQRYNANELVNIGAEIIGGRGGGKPDFAQAGGKAVEDMGAVIRKIEAHIAG